MATNYYKMFVSLVISREWNDLLFNNFERSLVFVQEMLQAISRGKEGVKGRWRIQLFKKYKKT